MNSRHRAVIGSPSEAMKTYVPGEDVALLLGWWHRAIASALNSGLKARRWRLVIVSDIDI